MATSDQNRRNREKNDRAAPAPERDQDRGTERNHRRTDIAGGEVSGQRGAEFFLLKVMGQQGGATYRVLRRAADPGHDRPEEKLKIALRQADKYESRRRH